MKKSRVLAGSLAAAALTVTVAASPASAMSGQVTYDEWINSYYHETRTHFENRTDATGNWVGTVNGFQQVNYQNTVNIPDGKVKNFYLKGSDGVSRLDHSKWCDGNGNCQDNPYL